MAGPTNTERIEANTAAIRSAERTLAVHEKQLTLLERDVSDLTDRFTNVREVVGRMDERLKHVERSVDRIWKLLLTLVAAAVIEVVRRVVVSLQRGGRELVLHYISAHWYLPPDECCEAVRCCPDQHTMEYKRSLLQNGGRRLLQALVANERESWDSQAVPTSFPGMDPYLETYWGSLHVELIVYARDQLHEQLPSDSATRIHERLHPTISGRIVRQLRVEECSREQPVVTVIEFPIAVHRAWKERRSEVYTGCFVRRENDNSR